MSVGIAAACCAGQYVVTATDGALSQGSESMDVALTKMYWFADREKAWQFLYAGEPSEADLVLENIRFGLDTDQKALSRERIQRTVREAYKKRFAEWTADYILAPYDMTMEEFKKSGRKIFGDDVAAKLAKEMSDAASGFREELMVIGWGKAIHSVMIYGMNQSGAWSGTLIGLGTIGSGREVAMSTLLLHGIGRHSNLEDTLYAVAAAKFSAERCEGVGRDTITMCVARKPLPHDSPTAKIHHFLTEKETHALRILWEQHGRVRVPDAGYETMMEISQRITGGVSVESIVHLHNSINDARTKPSISRKKAGQP